jgi:hypothetical protein
MLPEIDGLGGGDHVGGLHDFPGWESVPPIRQTAGLLRLIGRSDADG